MPSWLVRAVRRRPRGARPGPVAATAATRRTRGGSARRRCRPSSLGPPPPARAAAPAPRRRRRRRRRPSYGRWRRSRRSPRRRRGSRAAGQPGPQRMVDLGKQQRVMRDRHGPPRSGMAVGQHAVQLGRPRPAGATRRDPLAQRSRFSELAQERVPPAQSITVGHGQGIPLRTVTPTRQRHPPAIMRLLGFSRRLSPNTCMIAARWAGERAGQSAAGANDSGVPVPSIFSDHARRQDWHHHEPCRSSSGRRSSSPQYGQ